MKLTKEMFMKLVEHDRVAYKGVCEDFITNIFTIECKKEMMRINCLNFIWETLGISNEIENALKETILQKRECLREFYKIYDEVLDDKYKSEYNTQLSFPDFGMFVKWEERNYLAQLVYRPHIGDMPALNGTYHNIGFFYDIIVEPNEDITGCEKFAKFINEVWITDECSFNDTVKRGEALKDFYDEEIFPECKED